mmetsp:Transcript_3578/g.8157  ORF Transcript_3578/g.8157 Transcript_3578/m.8157 type:complete len:117 (-) Transcript_3578:1671-2021(-)
MDGPKLDLFQLFTALLSTSRGTTDSTTPSSDTYDRFIFFTETISKTSYDVLRLLVNPTEASRNKERRIFKKGYVSSQWLAPLLLELPLLHRSPHVHYPSSCHPRATFEQLRNRSPP